MRVFFDMGGYAAYVWPAYGAAAIILAGLLLVSIAVLRRRQRMLARLEGARERRR